MQPEQLNQLLRLGLQSGASDVHLKPGTPPAFRINGRLQYLQAEMLTAAATRAIAFHLVADPRVREVLDTLQEYDGAYSLAGQARFRVNLYRQRGSLSAILRIIPGEVPSLVQLGLPPEVVPLANEERGLVLVTGASGSSLHAKPFTVGGDLEENGRTGFCRCRLACWAEIPPHRQS